MKLVIIESPFAGEVEINIEYARRAMKHSVHIDEAPIASHLLYTQPGILDDLIPSERKLGIEAGLAWRSVAQLQAFYTDRGWSSGMLSALWQCVEEQRPYELRALNGEVRLPVTLQEEVEDDLKRHIRKCP